jgi:hypothetical protein
MSPYIGYLGILSAILFSNHLGCRSWTILIPDAVERRIASWSCDISSSHQGVAFATLGINNWLSSQPCFLILELDVPVFLLVVSQNNLTLVRCASWSSSLPEDHLKLDSLSEVSRAMSHFSHEKRHFSQPKSNTVSFFNYLLWQLFLFRPLLLLWRRNYLPTTSDEHRGWPLKGSLFCKLRLVKLPSWMTRKRVFSFLRHTAIHLQLPRCVSPLLDSKQETIYEGNILYI